MAFIDSCWKPSGSRGASLLQAVRKMPSGWFHGSVHAQRTWCAAAREFTGDMHSVAKAGPVKASSLVKIPSKVWHYVREKLFQTFAARGSDDGGRVSVALALSGGS